MSQCLPGCSWVLEPVFGPVKGRCGENEQELDKWSCIILVCDVWERPRDNAIGSQGRAWWRGGHLPHLHLPCGGQHGIWGATHHHLQRVRPVPCLIVLMNLPLQCIFCNAFARTASGSGENKWLVIPSCCFSAVARWWPSESSSMTCPSTYRAERKPSHFAPSRILWISFLGWVFCINSL